MSFHSVPAAVPCSKFHYYGFLSMSRLRGETYLAISHGELLQVTDARRRLVCSERSDLQAFFRCAVSIDEPEVRRASVEDDVLSTSEALVSDHTDILYTAWRCRTYKVLRWCADLDRCLQSDERGKAVSRLAFSSQRRSRSRAYIIFSTTERQFRTALTPYCQGRPNNRLTSLSDNSSDSHSPVLA